MATDDFHQLAEQAADRYLKTRGEPRRTSGPALGPDYWTKRYETTPSNAHRSEPRLANALRLTRDCPATDPQAEAQRRLDERHYSFYEDSALSFLECTLERTTGDPGSDYSIAYTWDPNHWPRLRQKLRHVHPTDHRQIDRVFADYARANRLLSVRFLSLRQATIDAENRYYEPRRRRDLGRADGLRQVRNGALRL